MIGVTRDSQLLISAPAKINLFFELIAKRPDGFHNVETIMSSISLCDTLSFQSRPNFAAIQFTAKWALGLRALSHQSNTRQSASFGDLPQDDSNLVVRALHLMQQTTGTTTGALVQLVKRIPSGAGLGGGSSDAAAALVAGNLGWNLGLSAQELHKLAEQLGSDVPFFLGTELAKCTGRGEILTALPKMPAIDIVLVRPPESLATGSVFRKATIPAKPNAIPKQFEGRIRSASDLRDTLFNRLQSAAEECTPWITRLERVFSQLPMIVAHQMSGSGSTYFGICRNRDDAKRAQRRLRAMNIGHVMRARTGSASYVSQVDPSTN